MLGHNFDLNDILDVHLIAELDFLELGQNFLKILECNFDLNDILDVHLIVDLDLFKLGQKFF